MKKLLIFTLFIFNLILTNQFVAAATPNQETPSEFHRLVADFFQTEKSSNMLYNKSNAPTGKEVIRFSLLIQASPDFDKSLAAQKNEIIESILANKSASEEKVKALLKTDGIIIMKMDMFGETQILTAMNAGQFYSYLDKIFSEKLPYTIVLETIKEEKYNAQHIWKQDSPHSVVTAFALKGKNEKPVFISLESKSDPNGKWHAFHLNAYNKQADLQTQIEWLKNHSK